MKILFLCRGNVARSQIAEAFLKRDGGEEFEAISAGTKLSGEEQSLHSLLPATKYVLEVMEEIGLPLGDKLRKNLTEDMVQSADKIVVMHADEDNIPESVSQSGKQVLWEVADPKGQSFEFTWSVRNEIEKRVRELVKDLQKEV